MDPASARRLFDENAATYDRVNTIISFGRDSRWRSWAAHRALRAPGDRILDAYGGAGEVALEAARLGGEVTLADLSPRMLALAESRARRLGLSIATVTADLSAPRAEWAVDVLTAGGDVRANGNRPAPSDDPTFDAVTVVFGVRYMDRPIEILSRLASLLADDGRLVVMEFVVPAPGPLSWPASLYFFHMLPFIGGILAGDRELYGELTRSTRELGGHGALEELVTSAGLRVAQRADFGLGMVCGLVATR